MSNRRPETSRVTGSKELWLWPKYLLALSLVFALVGGAAYTLLGDRDGGAATPRLTHQINRGPLRVTVTEKGTLESSNNVEVRSKVWGWKTVNWVVESGTEVKKGDVLVELDSSEMEKKVDDARINYHNARADMITARSNVEVAKKSFDEYLNATFVETEGSILQEIFDTEQEVTRTELALQSATRLAARGLIKPLQIRSEQFKRDSARQKLNLKQTRLDALRKYKKEKEIQRLKADIEAAEARLDAANARVDLAKTNVRQHEEQLAFHTIVAPQDGMVIHPKAAAHRNSPDVEEGANVHTNQVLLIMPDLDRMQVKLGIHESMIDRVDEGLAARVMVGDMVLEGTVREVAKVTKPATWYTGNVVKFDTVVSLPKSTGLKPGLSAEVEVIIAEHENEMTIPVAAVAEVGGETLCWVQSSAGPTKRRLRLGDSNEQFMVVRSGVDVGENVLLNPSEFLDATASQARVVGSKTPTPDVEHDPDDERDPGTT
ncbi:MAG: biotin/lipoyl-binding protein [Planctomycetota bacterium]